MTPKVPDYGHHESDKKLIALIRRLNVSYRMARISLMDKIEKYLEEFEKEDAYKRALYDSGELSHEEYTRWKYSTLAGTKQWKRMLNQLADDMTHQNQIAASMIDDTLPDVYALNHNYGTFEAEKGSGYDTTYTLYDKNTVKRLLTEHDDLLPHPSVPIEKDKLWNKQHLQSAVLQGILTGEPMSDIAKRFQSVTNMTEHAAMRNARTAVTGAENAGRIDSYIRAQNMGINMKQMWMATLDARTRDSHAMLDGEQQEVGKKFSNGCRYPGDPQGAASEVYNCFVGDTKIATDSEIIRSYKHDYSGELVTIKTARGVEFTCTPNHPIFTPIGWVSANTLHKGDDVFITFVGDEHLSGRNPNVDHVFPRIDAIHNLFNVIGCKRVSGLSVNFHGDIPTSEVEVVTHKRFLKDDRNTVFDKTSEKIIFKSSNKSFMSKCSFSEHLRRIWFSTLCFMSRLRKALSFFWSRISHSGKHGFGTVSESNSAVFQSQSDNMSGNIQFSSDGFDRPSCEVFIDNIIDIKISTVSHVSVYNLQTDKNYYFVSSIIPDFSEKCNGIPMVIAHNCRCTLVALVEGADPYNPNLRPSKYLKDEGLTYERWKEMHGERFYSKLFEDYEEPKRELSFAEQIANNQNEKLSPEEIFGFIKGHGERYNAWWMNEFGEDEDIQNWQSNTIEQTVARLQQKYPMQAKNHDKNDVTSQKIILTDYRLVPTYLPDGEDDRRYNDDWQILGQVFNFEKDGIETSVIGFHRISLSGDPDGFTKAIKRRSNAIENNIILDSLSDSSVEGVTIHEWGHNFINLHMDNAFVHGSEAADEYWKWYKTLTKDEIKQGISDYASTNRGEFEAECFLELQMPNPRPLAVKLWSFMERILEEGY